MMEGPHHDITGSCNSTDSLQTALEFGRSVLNSANICVLRFTTAVGEYNVANGQFIMSSPLDTEAKVQILIEGTGLIKIDSVKTRDDAVQWLRKKLPLQKGCCKLWVNKTCREIEAGWSTDAECIQICDKQSGIVQNISSEKHLVFDIVYGDVTVKVKSEIHSSVSLHPYYHSKNIRITNEPKARMARLCHFNPSGLCHLKDVCIKKGDIYRLEVSGNGKGKSQRSYFRFWAAPESNPFDVMSKHQACCADSMVFVDGTRTKQRILKICDYQMLSQRHKDSDSILYLDIPNRTKCTLWFELYRVSVVVRQHQECQERQRCGAQPVREHNQTTVVGERENREVSNPLNGSNVFVSNRNKQHASSAVHVTRPVIEKKNMALPRPIKHEREAQNIQQKNDFRLVPAPHSTTAINTSSCGSKLFTDNCVHPSGMEPYQAVGSKFSQRLPPAPHKALTFSVRTNNRCCPSLVNHTHAYTDEGKVDSDCSNIKSYVAPNQVAVSRGVSRSIHHGLVPAGVGSEDVRYSRSSSSTLRNNHTLILNKNVLYDKAIELPKFEYADLKFFSRPSGQNQEDISDNGDNVYNHNTNSFGVTNVGCTNNFSDEVDRPNVVPSNFQAINSRSECSAPQKPVVGVVVSDTNLDLGGRCNCVLHKETEDTSRHAISSHRVCDMSDSFVLSNTELLCQEEPLSMNHASIPLKNSKPEIPNNINNHCNHRLESLKFTNEVPECSLFLLSNDGIISHHKAPMPLKSCDPEICNEAYKGPHQLESVTFTDNAPGSSSFILSNTELLHDTPNILEPQKLLVSDQALETSSFLLPNSELPQLNQVLSETHGAVQQNCLVANGIQNSFHSHEIELLKLKGQDKDDDLRSSTPEQTFDSMARVLSVNNIYVDFNNVSQLSTGTDSSLMCSNTDLKTKFTSDETAPKVCEHETANSKGLHTERISFYKETFIKEKVSALQNVFCQNDDTGPKEAVSHNDETGMKQICSQENCNTALKGKSLLNYDHDTTIKKQFNCSQDNDTSVKRQFITHSVPQSSSLGNDSAVNDPCDRQHPQTVSGNSNGETSSCRPIETSSYNQVFTGTLMSNGDPFNHKDSNSTVTLRQKSFNYLTQSRSESAQSFSEHSARIYAGPLFICPEDKKDPNHRVLRESFRKNLNRDSVNASKPVLHSKTKCLNIID